MFNDSKPSGRIRWRKVMVFAVLQTVLLISATLFGEWRMLEHLEGDAKALSTSVQGTV